LRTAKVYRVFVAFPRLDYIGTYLRHNVVHIYTYIHPLFVSYCLTVQWPSGWTLKFTIGYKMCVRFFFFFYYCFTYYTSCVCVLCTLRIEPYRAVAVVRAFRSLSFFHLKCGFTRVERIYLSPRRKSQRICCCSFLYTYE